MAVKIGSLFFDMRVGLAAWQRDMGRASKRLSRFGRSIGRVAKHMSIFGGAVSGVGLVLLADRVIEAADQVDKLSLRLGASTEALSQYRHVAEITGVQFNTLTMAWQRMTRRVSEAAVGMGEARDALKELGLSAVALNRLAPEQQFEVLADALMDVESQTDRVRLAFKLFDSEGVAVLQTMQGGSEAMRALRGEADRLGKTLTREQVDKLVAAKDAWTRFKASVEGMVQTFVVEMGPTLAAIGEWLAERLPAALSWGRDGFARFFQAVLHLTAKTEVAFGRLLIALAPLVGGDLERKYKEWARAMLDAADSATEASLAIERGFEVNLATVGRFDETLKRHAGSWEAVKTKAEEAGDEMAAAAEKAEKELDGAKLASEGLGDAIEDVGGRAIAGQIQGWQTLGEVATSVLNDMLRMIIRVAAQMAAAGLSGLFAGGGGLGPQYTGTGAGGLASSGSFARGGSFKVGGAGGPDSQLMVARVTPGERVDFTPPGAARAAPVELKVEINNTSAEPVRATPTPGGARIDIGQAVGGAVAEELRRNPGGPLGSALGDFSGLPGPRPFGR